MQVCLSSLVERLFSFPGINQCPSWARMNDTVCEKLSLVVLF